MKMSSKQLIIDTATKYIYLSLVIDGIEKASIYQEGINNHSVTIIPLLEDILSKEHLRLKDIDDVIIGIGPGSYTGVRIGVTVAKMIGYLNHINVYSISSLALLASVSDQPYVVPYIDARRGNAFIALFEQKEGQLSYLCEDVHQSMETFLQTIDTAYELVNQGKPKAEKIIRSRLLHKVEDINELQPNYLRMTEAERKQQKNA